MPLRRLKLPLDAKRHIVRALARRVPHADIVRQVQERFDVTVHRRALAHYNPKFNARLDLTLRAIYDEEKALVERERAEETQRWRAQRRQAHDATWARSEAKLRAQVLEAARAALQSDGDASAGRGRHAKRPK